MSSNTTAIFDGIDPERVWRHFETITQIARPSAQEAVIAAKMKEWAERLGFAVREDAARNLCITVPATKGLEAAPIVVLQGHLDMVVANSNEALPEFDAGEGRIHLIRKHYPDGEYIEADLTTLGADNGIAIAMMCGLAEDPAAIHGPIELLMTVEEETGLYGAAKLDPSMINGRIMLNLDSEDDHILFVGCAGGTDLRLRWLRDRTAIPNGWVGLTVGLDKLRGGHSGAEIDKNRLNANKALARMLAGAGEGVQHRLASIEGGDRRNAIARFAKAEIWVAASDEARFRSQLTQAHEAVCEQYRKLEPTIELSIGSKTTSNTAFDEANSSILIGLLQSVPSGVLFLSQDLPGLVETSNNIGIVSTEGDHVEIVLSLRSSVAQAMDDLTASLKALGRLAGATSEVLSTYPGWEVNLDSQVLKVAKGVYAKVFGSEPSVEAIHAGLEAGVIAARIEGGLDVISFGPNIRGAHAPGERVSIGSVGKSYKFLKALLEDLSKQ